MVAQIPMISRQNYHHQTFANYLSENIFSEYPGALIPLAGFYGGGIGDVSFDPFETSKFLRSVLQLPFLSSLLTLNTGPIVLGW